MSVQSLELIKQQIASLSRRERAELSEFLAEQMKQDRAASSPASLLPEADEAAEIRRRQHSEWLKAHREEYAGQYVALDGDRLVGQGRTLKEASEQARQSGVANPFLVRVTSENEVLFGGW
jgi:hypothetical protein